MPTPPSLTGAAGRPADPRLGPDHPVGWILRVLAVGWCVRIFVGTLGDREYRSLWSGITLGFHELGHIVLMPLGMFPGVAGGTLFQLAIPALAAFLLHRQGDPVGFSVGLVWLGTALVEMGAYVGDARARALQLVSPFSGEPIHDWEWMLGRVGLLEQDLLLGGVCHFSGVVLMAAALLLGVNALLVTRPGRGNGPPEPGSGRPSMSIPQGGMPEEGLEPPTRGL